MQTCVFGLGLFFELLALLNVVFASQLHRFALLIGVRQRARLLFRHSERLAFLAQPLVARRFAVEHHRHAPVTARTRVKLE